jgi:hypothetical protein
MLAVTHHFIVQQAYRRAYNISPSVPLTLESWYQEYELLGDDIILFDPLVAAEYLTLMEAYGVPINTTKSVVATVPVTEFAKVTSLHGKNVSALSWKMFMSGNSFAGRMNMLFSILSRGIVSKNIIPYISRCAGLTLHNPGNLTPTLLGLFTMLSNNGVIPLEEAFKALINGKVLVFNFAKAILANADINKLKLAIPRLFQTGEFISHESKWVPKVFAFEKPWFQIALWKPVAVAQFGVQHRLEAEVKDLSVSLFRILVSSTNLTIPEDFNFFDLTLDLEC